MVGSVGRIVQQVGGIVCVLCVFVVFELWFAKFAPVFTQLMPHLKKHKIENESDEFFFHSYLCFLQGTCFYLRRVMEADETSLVEGIVSEVGVEELDRVLLGKFGCEFNYFRSLWNAIVKPSYSKFKKCDFGRCDTCEICSDATRKVLC